MDETLPDYSITKPKKRCDTPKHRKVQDSLEETPHWKSNHLQYRSSKALFEQRAKVHSLFSLTSVTNAFGFGCFQVAQPTPSDTNNPKDSDEAKSDSVTENREDIYSREELSSFNGM